MQTVAHPLYGGAMQTVTPALLFDLFWILNWPTFCFNWFFFFSSPERPDRVDGMDFAVWDINNNNLF